LFLQYKIKIPYIEWFNLINSVIIGKEKRDVSISIGTI
jgi:hypothetical protein